MNTQIQTLSVLDVSAMCNVARSTVSYWITQKGLSAGRSGNKFMVAIEDLIIFLESMGRPVPENIVKLLGGVFSYPFKSYRNCWDYWQKDPHGEKCENCVAFKCQINECFTVRNNRTECSTDCSKCQYFYEHYVQYTSFIQQMPMPVAVFKDMYVWSGNKAWADLCGTDIDWLIGVGIEEIIHPDSIRDFINYNKQIRQQDNSGLFKSTIFLENQKKQKINARLVIAPLKKPEGACFVIAEKIDYLDG